MNKLINQLLQKGNLSSTGESMLPILQSKDRLKIIKVGFHNLHVNDIIIFTQAGRVITHRIIYINPKYVLTRGDNNFESDRKIYPKQIIGRVDSFTRGKLTSHIDQIYLIQSSLYFQEICLIINEFKKKGIEYVILKGLPLHMFFEKSHPRRIYADCDILIKKNDFPIAEKIIKKMGYKNAGREFKQVENNYHKIIKGFPVVLDIHLEPAFLMTKFSGLEALYPQKLIDKLTEELFNNKRQITINNQPFLILNSKFLILYLALHLFHHNFRGAFRYGFLDKIIKKSHFAKWELISQVIREYRLQNFVYPVFILLKKYYKTPIPNFFIKLIKPDFMNFIDFKNLPIFDDEPRTAAGINRFKNLFFLSPQPLWRKLTVFFHPQVVYFIFWTLWRKLSSFFANR